MCCNNGCGWGGNSCLWIVIILIILFSCGGWNSCGGGCNCGNGNCGGGCGC